MRLPVPLFLAALCGSCLIPPLDPAGKVCSEMAPCPEPYACIPPAAGEDRVCTFLAGPECVGEPGPEQCDGQDHDCDGRADVARARALGTPGAVGLALLRAGDGYVAAVVRSGPQGEGLWLLRLTAELDPVGDPQELSAAGRSPAAPALARLGTGEVLVAWREVTAHGTAQLGLAWVDLQEGQVTSPLLLPVPSVEHGPRIAADPAKGSMLVAWTTLSGELRAWTREATGEALALRSLTSGVLPGGGGQLAGELDVAPDGEGGYLVAWAFREDERLGVRLQRLDRDAAPQGPVGGVALDATALPRGLRVGLGTDGQAVLAFLEPRPGGTRVRAASGSYPLLAEHLVALLPSGEAAAGLDLLTDSGGSSIVAVAHGEGAATAVSLFTASGQPRQVPVLLEPDGVGPPSLAAGAPGRVAVAFRRDPPSGGGLAQVVAQAVCAP